MEPLSMATAPSSMFGPAMVSTVPWRMTMSTCFGAARSGAARRKTRMNSFLGMGTEFIAELPCYPPAPSKQRERTTHGFHGHLLRAHHRRERRQHYGVLF